MQANTFLRDSTTGGSSAVEQWTVKLPCAVIHWSVVQIHLPGIFIFRLVLFLSSGKSISVPRLELGIFRVLGERHNQLDHTDVDVRPDAINVMPLVPLPTAKRKRILDGIRTRNPQIRSLVRCPLRHKYPV